jgi:hypothetical protein
MKRRAFLGVLGGAVAWPLAARGQTSAKIPRIDLLWREASTEEAVIYLGADLTLQLPFCFEVGALSGGLVSSTPE